MLEAKIHPGYIGEVRQRLSLRGQNIDFDRFVQIDGERVKPSEWSGSGPPEKVSER